MKKLTLLLCLALCCAASPNAPAQTSPISFGLKGGVNIATVGGEDAELKASNFIPLGGLGQFGGFDLTAEPMSKTLFTGGAYVAYSIIPMLSVQVEAMYSSKGVKYDRDFAYSLFGSTISGNLKADAELSYIEVPLFIKFILPVEGSLKPYLYAGPSFGFLADKSTAVNAHVITNFNGERNEVDVPVPATFTFKDLDIGAAFGGGISFRMMGTAIGAEARYTLGFQSAVESVQIEGGGTGQGESSELDMKNRALSITAFMEFYF